MREIEFRCFYKKTKKMVGPFECGSRMSMMWPAEMQYTGLKDKNGVKIFEGDVIKAEIPEHNYIETMGQVVWDNDHSAFANKNEGGLTLILRVANIEVIGNIWENPELCEVK